MCIPQVLAYNRRQRPPDVVPGWVVRIMVEVVVDGLVELAIFGLGWGRFT